MAVKFQGGRAVNVNTAAIQVSADLERAAVALDKASRQLKVAANGDAALMRASAKADSLRAAVWELSALVKREA